MSAVNTKPGTDGVRTTCPYCGVGCGIIANRDKAGSISIQGDLEHPANYGRLCSKGSALAETLSLDDRLLYPEVAGRRVDWNEALTTVANRIRESIEKHGPESVAFYVSGQLLTEDYYVANKLMKGCIGTANIDTNSRLCMSSAVAGYKRAFGADFVPCSYSDIELAELLVIAGSNMAWCHPVLFQRIARAKENNPQLKVVVIDPRRTATCDIADLHLAIKPGTDVALFNGLLNHLRQEDVLDWKFLENHCDGFATAFSSAKQDAPSIPHVASICDLRESNIAAFYRLFAQTEKTVTLFSQGINQSSRGTDKVNAIINCHLASGRIGKPGTGPFSITGQPNAMGGREVGGLANQLAAHMDIENPQHRDKVRRFWGTDTIAGKAGLKTMDMFRAIENDEIRVLWIMATNPVDSLPDADRFRAALRKCETVIVSDCIRHTDTNREADILLPAQAWGEKDGTVTNSERRISRQRAFLTAPGEAKPDWWIITQVARRLGYQNFFNYETSVEIFREHAALSGFENSGERDFDISAFSRITAENYEKFLPVRWPVTDNADNSPISEGRFFNDNGKARLIAVTCLSPTHQANEEYPFILNTGRVRDHWHTLTRTGKSPRLSQHTSEPYCDIHPLDAARMQIADGMLVLISSQWGSMISRARYSDKQLRGNIFVPIHWTDQFASNARVAAVVNPATDEISGQPESKHTPVTAVPFPVLWEGLIITSGPLKHIQADYRVMSRGYNCWQYRLAGTDKPLDWQEWARYHMMYDADHSEWLEYSDTGTGCYRAAIIHAGKLESCLFIARNRLQLPDRNRLQELFSQTDLKIKQRTSILAGKSGDTVHNSGPIVCSCFSVGRNTLQKIIREKNLTDLATVGEHLRAGTNCGSCIPELRQLLQNSNRSI